MNTPPRLRTQFSSIVFVLIILMIVSCLIVLLVLVITEEYQRGNLDPSDHEKDTFIAHLRLAGVLDEIEKDYKLKPDIYLEKLYLFWKLYSVNEAYEFSKKIKKIMDAGNPEEYQIAKYQRSLKFKNLIRRQASSHCPECGAEAKAENNVCYNCSYFIPKCMVCKSHLYEGEDILTCSECEYSGHEEHVENWINIKSICPNCRVEWK